MDKIIDRMVIFIGSVLIGLGITPNQNGSLVTAQTFFVAAGVLIVSMTIYDALQRK